MKKTVLTTIAFFLLFAAVIIFLIFPKAGGAVSESGIGVGLIVTNCGNGVIDTGETCDNGASNGVCPATCSASCTNNSCGEPPGGDSTGPNISVVSTSVSNNSFYIKWALSDTSGISTTSFNFGIGNYNSTGTVVVLGGDVFEMTLSNLDSNTGYQYIIYATDAYTPPNNSQITGSFTTFVVVDGSPQFSVVSSSVGVTTATLSWSVTDNGSISSVSFIYGTSTNYGLSTQVLGLGNYSTSLENLSSNTLYYYKITATDNVGQSASTTGSFQTSEASMPLTISNISTSTGVTTAVVSFNTNRPTTAQILYRTLNGVESTFSINSSSAAHTATLGNLTANTNYYFRIVASDQNGSVEVSGLTFRTQPDLTPPPNVTNYQLTTTSNSIILNWTNPSLLVVPDFSGVKILRSINSPATGPNDSGAGFSTTTNGQFFTDNSVLPNIDYYYSIFSFDTSGNFSSGVYRLGRIFSTPTTTPTTTPVVEICDNNLDDDSNGLVDCNDPGCTSFCTPVIPTSTVPDFIRIDFNNLIFLAGNRLIALVPVDRTVFGLEGSVFTIGVPKTALLNTPQSMVFRMSGQNYLFSFSTSSDVYYTDVVLPATGKRDVLLEVDYGLNQLDSVSFSINSLPRGKVVSDGENIVGAEINLFKSDGTMPYLGVYGQQNPVFSDDFGYGWMVPRGDYYLQIKLDGFYERRTPIFRVNSSVVNQNINLIKQPPKIIDIIDPDASVGENTVKIAKNLLQKTGVLSQIATEKAVDFIENPDVEKATTEIVVPTVVGVAAVGTAAASWANFLLLLRFLFLQPLMLFGRGKREKWGVVYHSLTKLPIDLAIVRLFNAETNRLVQSKVTDAKGRYAFVVDAGLYRLEVQKGGLIFPSTLLKGFKNDGGKLDIYHGEPIKVSEKNSLITANIPLDPVGETKTPKRIVREKIARKLQFGLSWLGFLVTVASLVVYPIWYMWILLAIHLFFLFVFRRINKPKRAKGWGIVYDANTSSPVAKVVARLFDSQFNKLVATEVTDRKGRYHFLAGENNYYVTYEHRDYEPAKVDVTSASKKDSGAIAEDVKIKKKNG